MRARVRGDAAFQLRWVNVVSLRAAVGENRRCAERAYGTSGGHKSGCRQQHFVASPHAARAQSQNQRICAGGDACAVCDTAEPGDFRFEGFAFPPEHKMLLRQNALYGGSNLRANGRILNGKIELRNRFNGRIRLRMRAHSLF